MGYARDRYIVSGDLSALDFYIFLWDISNPERPTIVQAVTDEPEIPTSETPIFKDMVDDLLRRRSEQGQVSAMPPRDALNVRHDT